MRYCHLKHKQRNHKTGSPSKVLQFVRELNMIYANEKPANNMEPMNTDMPIYKCFEFLDNSAALKGVLDIQRKDFQHKIRKKEDKLALENKTHLEFSSKKAKGSIKSSVSESEGKSYLHHNMPELVAFIQESDEKSENLLKGIMMDINSVNQDRNYELDHYNVSSSVHNSDTESCNSIKETLDRLHCIANELEFVSCEFIDTDELEVAVGEEDDEYFDGRDDILVDHTYKNKTNDCEKEQDCYKNVAKDHNFEGKIGDQEQEEIEKQELQNSTEAADYNCPTSDDESTTAISLNSSTSGRSFAFPILSSELLESPKVMTPNIKKQSEVSSTVVNKEWQEDTANRRYWQRPLCWRALICCKGR